MASHIKTRKDLFELYRAKFVIKKSPVFIKSIAVGCNSDFREAISVCLQELLGINHMENLSPPEVVEFEREVEIWYKNVPRDWKKRGKDYRSFKIHHNDFLTREVHLGNFDENPYSRVHILINFNHIILKILVV